MKYLDELGITEQIGIFARVLVALLDATVRSIERGIFLGLDRDPNANARHLFICQTEKTPHIELVQLARTFLDGEG
jgi:hypothetical protein